HARNRFREHPGSEGSDEQEKHSAPAPFLVRGPNGVATYRLPVVAETVVVQRDRGTGGGAEALRAVVGVVVGRHRVRRGTGLFGGLNLDVAVTVDTGTGGDQLTDDHVLLEADEL